MVCCECYRVWVAQVLREASDCRESGDWHATDVVVAPSPHANGRTCCVASTGGRLSLFLAPLLYATPHPTDRRTKVQSLDLSLNRALNKVPLPVRYHFH